MESPKSADSTVLIVDDDQELRGVLSTLVQRHGWTPVEAASGAEALALVRQSPPSMVLLDIRLHDTSGAEVLTQIKAERCDVPVVIITGYGNIQQAVQMVKAGAYDYLTKPFNNEDVALTIGRALGEFRLKAGIQRLCRPTASAASLHDSMGSGKILQGIVTQVSRVAQTSISVLITGETGVGKELVAQAIHTGSRRSGQPFVAVDCGAIAESLIESELFGHEKGAFTGADRAVAGAFELASGGTLFLDEIGNLPVPMQQKLLRALEERRIHRLGSQKTIAVDCRIVAATNADPQAMLYQHTFRQDLYHRLAEFTIHVPPLRERREDLVFLVNRRVTLTNQELGLNVREISTAAWERIHAYDWPGNVRELHNVIRRAVLLVADPDGVITPEHLGDLGASTGFERRCMRSGAAHSSPGRISDAHLWSGTGARPPSREWLGLKEIVQRAVREVERSALVQALERAKGNKAAAARLLQIDYKTIHTKLKVYGLAGGWLLGHGRPAQDLVTKASMRG